MPRIQNSIMHKRQSRKMICDVYDFMRADAAGNNLKLTNKELEQKTAEATKESLSIIRRIIREELDHNNISHNVPPGPDISKQDKLVEFSPLEQGQLKRIIHNFHVTEGEMLTMEKLLKKLTSMVKYKGSEQGLPRTIHSLGFRWMKVEGDKRLLIEKSNIRLQRIEYLQKLRNYRKEGKQIVYTNHAFIESPLKDENPANRIYMVVFSASTDTMFISDTLYGFGTSKADYDDYFYQKYEKWLRKYLVPNVPDNSVIVVGSEKCYDKEFDAISSCAKRSELIDWLEQNHIEFNRNWLKPQLYNLVKKLRALNKEFLVDKLLSEHNLPVLRIPQAHPDLNPLQIASEDIKAHVKSKETLFTMVNVMEAVKEKVAEMSDGFKTLGRRIKDIEQEYRKSDFVIDTLTEEFKFYGGESDQDDEVHGSDDEPLIKITRLE